MVWDKLAHVLRILDNENRLLERADNKAISLLSILGVFMVFFIVYYRIIPINAFTVSLIIIYFGLALLAIFNLIMAVRPRIQALPAEGTPGSDKALPCEPAFFAGICQYPTLTAYRQSLEDMLKDETSVIEIYTRQIFSLSRINEAKYKYVQRAVILVILALAAELTMIVYLFSRYMGAGALPPIM